MCRLIDIRLENYVISIIVEAKNSTIEYNFLRRIMHWQSSKAVCPFGRVESVGEKHSNSHGSNSSRHRGNDRR